MPGVRPPTLALGKEHMNDDQHSMTLEDFARLAQLSQRIPRHDDGAPIIITPTLARALDDLIEAAAAGLGRVPIEQALDQLRVLHDYTRVRLGGERR